MAAIDAAVASFAPGEVRIALLAGGEVVELIVDRGGLARGDIVAGRVVEVAPQLGAAFVAIGEPEPGYVAKKGGLAVGATALFAVVVGARPGKGAELKLAPAGSEENRQPALAHALADFPTIQRVAVDDPAALPEARRLFPAATLEPRCFEESGAADALEEALARRVPLAGGGSLVFAETEAATVIDIDGAGAAPAAVNEAAMPAIAHHLRLRNLAGHILIDAIPTRGRGALPRLVAALRAAVADDPAPVQVAGRTPLGMIELTRRRRGPSLAEVMLEPAEPAASAETAGLQGLRALLREAAARPGAALALALPPRAARRLHARPDMLAEAGRRMGRPVVVVERGDIELFAIEELPR